MRPGRVPGALWNSKVWLNVSIELGILAGRILHGIPPVAKLKKILVSESIVLFLPAGTEINRPEHALIERKMIQTL
jgi:hypothetical protein